MTVFYDDISSPFAKVYARDKFYFGQFAKVNYRKMQKFHEYFLSRKFVILSSRNKNKIIDYLSKTVNSKNRCLIK